MGAPLVDCPTELTLVIWICQLCSMTNTSKKYERTFQGTLLGLGLRTEGRQTKRWKNADFVKLRVHTWGFSMSSKQKMRIDEILKKIRCASSFLLFTCHVLVINFSNFDLFSLLNFVRGSPVFVGCLYNPLLEGSL